MKFNFGFIINGRKFGWSEKELYSLPFETDHGHFRALKKMKLVRIGNNYGYRFLDKPRTLKQLELLTHSVCWKIEIIQHDDLPF